MAALDDEEFVCLVVEKLARWQTEYNEDRKMALAYLPVDWSARDRKGRRRREWARWESVGRLGDLEGDLGDDNAQFRIPS